MNRQCLRTVNAIRITIALAAILSAPASLTAQPAAVPATTEGQVNTEQQTFTVGGFIPDAPRRTARPPTDVEAARDTRDPWGTGTLPDASVWRSSARPARGGDLTTTGDAGASRVGTRGAADAAGRSAAADATPPKVDAVFFVTDPQRGDTYAIGDEIEVWILFDEDITLTWSGGVPQLTLALQIGAATRRVQMSGCINHRPGASLCEGPTSGFVFPYTVQPTDYDPDGVSIAADALRLNGTRIRDLAGNDAHLSLGPHAITNDPAHKVNGGLDYPPMITEMSMWSRPQRNDTYGRGELIVVWFDIDEPVTVTGRPTLALTIGSRTREAAGHITPARDVVEFSYHVDTTDKDMNGISIGADALRLHGGSIRDASGNPLPTNLAAFAFTDDPDHKVDGTVEYLPKIDEVVLWSSPQYGDTYGRGETIEVRVSFDATVRLKWPRDAPPPLELTLQIGDTVRRAEGITQFRYEVEASEHDLDGVSIAPNALRLVRGTIRDVLGRDVTDLSLGAHAIANDPAHKVDGRPLVAVGTLPPLELVAGDAAAAVEVAQAFQGVAAAYTAVSSNPEVATVAVSGAVVTVSPVAGGTATIEVTARSATEMATQTFVVTVVPALEAVGTLPPLELVAGGAAATVDLAPAFRGRVTAYAAASSNPEVATVAVSGAELTVSPVVEGTATVSVIARNATETAIQSFVVTVVTDPAEVRVLEHTLAAFGRSLLASVTMTVEGRFAAAPGATTITVAGRRLPVGTGAGGQWVGHGGGRGGRLTGDDLLRGSHFLLALDAGQADGAADEAGGAGARWTVWGTGDLQSFAGELERGASYDGDMRAGHVGVDVGGEQWLAGVFMSRSAGRADYRFSGAATGSGRVATTLTSVQPYLRWTPRRGTSVWTILGAGGGSVENVRAHVGDRREQSELSMRLGVVGGRQTLASVGRVELALRGEVGVLRLDTGGGAEVIDGLTATVQRYRVGVETSHTTQWARGTTLTPFAVVGARHDGGDGQTGSGLELEGGIRLADARTGVGLEARGRMLTLRTTGHYRERGMSVTALWTPGGTGDRGLLVAVTPRWGAAAGGVDALWRERVFGDRPARIAADAGAVDARVGYGIALRAGRVLTAFSEVGVRDDDHRRLRVGLRLTGAAHTLRPVHVELAGERTETGWGEVDHHLGLVGVLTF